MPDTADVAVPSLPEIEAARARLGDRVLTTPIHAWRGPQIAEAAGADTEVVLKLELWQYTGTFKPRGALSVMQSLDQAALARGVTAVSAGNHAIAVAYAAKMLGTTAKVVMMKTASPYRVAMCRRYGAEIELAQDIQAAFVRVKEIESDEGRTFVHPFEGPQTIRGTATVGLEFIRQAPDLDAVIVAIGGGGLAAGVSAAIKQARPGCQVIGVEPEGADSMSRSLKSGKPESLAAVRTIADSLGAPYALPGGFALCRRFLDDIVLIDDDAMRRAMALLFREMKLACEPAGAAATAALTGPLRARLAGRRVGVIVCGSNIDAASFTRELMAAEGAA
jgi:threonine dehydratase